jgi:hypothetical protein
LIGDDGSTLGSTAGMTVTSVSGSEPGEHVGSVGVGVELADVVAAAVSTGWKVVAAEAPSPGQNSAVLS